MEIEMDKIKEAIKNITNIDVKKWALGGDLSDYLKIENPTEDQQKIIDETIEIALPLILRRVIIRIWMAQIPENEDTKIIREAAIKFPPYSQDKNRIKD